MAAEPTAGVRDAYCWPEPQAHPRAAAYHEAFPGSARERRRVDCGGSGRGPRPSRRERRRQVHAHERRLRASRRQMKARSSSTARLSRFARHAMRSRCESAWCTSTSCSSNPSPSPRTSCSASSRRHGSASSTARCAREKVVDDLRALRAQGRPRRAVADLSVGMQQRVEILKALYRDAGSSSSTNPPRF